MSSCEDTNKDIEKAIIKASKIALTGIYNKIVNHATNTDPVNSPYKDTHQYYKVDDRNVFHANLFDSEKPEYKIKDTFNNNLTLDSKVLLTNGKHNLFIYNENDNTSNIYANCAAKYGNIWFTSSNTSNNRSVCTIDKNIQLPHGLEFNSDKSLITLNLKSKDPNKNAYCSYEFRENKAYCENRWYDWIITPNYYLGNTYFKDIGKYTENDIFKCYKPCDGDRMPYTNSKGEYKCIHKKYYENGIFSKKYMFSPIGLINLIGNIAMFNNSDTTTDADVKNTSIYILHNLIINYKLINNVDTDIYITNSNLKGVIQNSNLLSEYRNIITDFKNCVNDNILQDFEESKQDYKNSNFFSYKSPLFNEDEPELYTIKGLDANNILIDPILLHTWILANIFKPLVDDNISSFITANDDTMRKLLYEKLWVHFTNENKAARLKNIFFKAVNMCYDNKTDFSRNIIKYTKKSLTSSTNNLIINKYLTNYNNAFINIVDFNNITINTLTVNAIDNFKENKYYDDYSLYSLEKNLKVTDEYSELYDKGNTLEPFKDNILKNKYKYFYTVEYLEKDICDGEYDDYGKCLIAQPVTLQNNNDNNNNDDKSLNDEFNMPNFKNLILLFLRIVVVIIIIYIIYIFKDIFGETISVFLNTIYVNFLETFYITLNEKFGNDNDTSKYWKDKAYVDKKELENIEYKIRKMEQFKQENNL